MRHGRIRNIKETGITLVALVVTIIVLLILAGVTINLALSNNGLIQRAKDASETYQKAEQNEQHMLSQFAEDIDKLTGKTDLSEDKIATINEKLKTAETLQKIEVGYEAKEIQDETSEAGKGRKVTVEGAYSGEGLDQTFYQSEVGAIGTNKLKWYTLSADEKGVNLVSEVTKKSVTFEGAAGYDNCLYYLNELSMKLFANEDYGVTADRIHALNLTDIKKAAERANVGTEWNWDTDVMSKLSKGSGATLGAQKTYTNTSYTYHPAIYPVKEGTTEVEANNPMYDEKPGSKITDSGIKREETGNPSSKLIINNTAAWDGSVDRWKGKLGTFGSSQVAGELFKSGNSYWLASRCVEGNAAQAYFGFRYVESGYLNIINLCWAGGGSDPGTFPLRVVVSVPGDRVDIADDGTVTLKAKKS